MFLLRLAILLIGWCWALAAYGEDASVVFNHVSGAPTQMDEWVHQHFGKRYKVVDFTDKQHQWIHPRGVSGFGPHPPVFLDNRCVSGFALVVYVISVDGRVMDAHAARSTTEFLASQAVRSMSERRFIPGHLDGKPVCSIAATNIQFRCPETSAK
ncbi:MAG TPA: hypothetical protein VKF40_02155 [Burkholderiales bacterium]|nr:hypothetical protein [Burkholderiales bacterium]